MVLLFLFPPMGYRVSIRAPRYRKLVIIFCKLIFLQLSTDIMSRFSSFLFVFALIFHSASGQTISNVRAEVMGDIINIYYDLAGDPTQQFDVSIYGSHNNYTLPLQRVTGDIGTVAPGLTRKVIWEARRELTRYRGEIIFEIRALVTTVERPDLITLVKPRTGAKVKAGKFMGVEWTGGKPGMMKLELYQGNSLYQNMGEGQNTGTFSWLVPESVKGSGYKVKLFNVNDPNAHVFSGEFKIAGKMGVAIYLVPAVAVVGGVAALVCCKGCNDVCNPNCENYNPSDPSCTDIPPVDPLPTPPLPPGG